MRLILVLLMVNLGIASVWGEESPIAALTQDGRKVLLYPDGTWKLADQAQPQGSAVQGSNSAPGNTPGMGNRSAPGNGSQNAETENNSPPGNSKTFVKAPQGEFGVWIDKQKWTQTQSDDPIRITFMHQGESSYAMIVAERARVSLEALERAALANAKKAAPDMTLLFKEKRTVGGKSVLCMQMTGTIMGNTFMYYGDYYGGPEGTLQVICYATPEQFDQAKADFDELLGGIQIGRAGNR
jgi:hypothetical protein